MGLGRYDAQDQLEKIEELHDVTLVEAGQLDVGDLGVRLEELKALRQGWFDGETGDALNQSGLSQVSSIIEHLHEQEELPIPFLYPTPDGALQAEWSLGSWELSAAIDLTSGDTLLDAVDANTNAGKDGSMNLFTPGGQEALVKFVTSVTRKGSI